MPFVYDHVPIQFLMTISEHNFGKYNSWFPFEDFNRIQKQCLNPILESDENIVISSPTGSGKTTLFELAMIRLFNNNEYSSKKILYLSPMRALCTEKTKLWKNKLESVGRNCIELIGGDDSSESNIDDYDLIISTPEKWDYMTRANNFTDFIGLILVY